MCDGYFMLYQNKNGLQKIIAVFFIMSHEIVFLGFKGRSPLGGIPKGRVPLAGV